MSRQLKSNEWIYYFNLYEKNLHQFQTEYELLKIHLLHWENEHQQDLLQNPVLKDLKLNQKILMKRILDQI